MSIRLHMKRKTKRQFIKKWTVIVASFGFLVFLFNLIKDSVFPILKPKLMSWFSSTGKEDSATLLLYAASAIIIILLSLLITKIILYLTSPDEKYFKYVDFKKPHDEVIRRATEGILNSEKSQPEFVHVAPVNIEIGIFSKLLDANDFVWENGKPGEGKTMLAYHALYRQRYPVGFTYRGYFVTLTKRRYKVYKLNMDRVGDKTEIKTILDELDNLDGGRHKIILIDDAHKLVFEDELRYEFEQEAKEKKNGKFVWINTNYFESKDNETDDVIRIDFEKFFPRLIENLYHSKHPVISKVVELMATGLQEAINLKHQGKISDPWHFNFIATEAVNRINNLLEKLSTNKTEQDILVMSLFLFSARNIMAGEKEINISEFADILSNVRIDYFRTNINRLTPEYIITQLSSQDKGRFIIIENRRKMDKGFLRAPHYKLSKALVSVITTYFTDKNFIHQILDSTQILLGTNYMESRYVGVFYLALGNYKTFFLDKNKQWLINYLRNPMVEQFPGYPHFLNKLKKNHFDFFQELINEEFIVNYAELCSSVGPNRFKVIQELIYVLGINKRKLLDKLDWDRVIKNFNKAVAKELIQVANFTQALGTEKQKLFSKLDWDILARNINKAEIYHFRQVANFIKVLVPDSKHLMEKLDWDRLAKLANSAEVYHLGQVADLIRSTGTDNYKLIDKLNWVLLAQVANNADIIHFGQIASFVSSLGTAKLNLISKLDFNRIAQKVNQVTVHQLNNVAVFLEALENSKYLLIEKLDWGSLANGVNKAEPSVLKQVGIFINSLKESKHKLFEKLDWSNLIQIVNKTALLQFEQAATFIIALGDDRSKLIDNLDWISLARCANYVEVHQLSQVTQFLNSLGGNKKHLIEKLDWTIFAKKINNAEVHQLDQVAVFINALDEDREKLVLKLDMETLAQSANRVQVHQLKQVADFIYVLRTEKLLFTNLLDNDWLINISTQVEKHQLIPFSTIISLLEKEKQTVLIEKIDWISLLKKITILHNNDVKCLAAILLFINKKQDNSNAMEDKRVITERLEGYTNLVYFATNYFVSPDDFNNVAKLIKNLIPYGLDLPQRIINLLKEKIIFDFRINSIAYQGFSNLLEAIKEVDLDSCTKILENPMVLDKLVVSINSEDLADKSEYLNSLLEMIKGISVPAFEIIMKKTKPQ